MSRERERKDQEQEEPREPNAGGLPGTADERPEGEGVIPEGGGEKAGAGRDGVIPEGGNP